MKKTMFIWAILIGAMILAPVFAAEIPLVPDWKNYKDSKSDCFGCHINLTETTYTDRKEVIEPAVIWQKDNNIHKDEGVDCEVCHKLVYGEYEDMRMDVNFDCKECHGEQFADETNLHVRVVGMMENLGSNGVVCSDCHGPHSTHKLEKVLVPKVHEAGLGRIMTIIVVLIVVLIGVAASMYKKQEEQGGE